MIKGKKSDCVRHFSNKKLDKQARVNASKDILVAPLRITAQSLPNHDPIRDETVKMDE